MEHGDFLKETLFIVTFDEGAWVGPNQIYTVLLNDSLTARVDSEKHNHYSLLKLIEDQFDLGDLGMEDVGALEIKL